MYTVELDFGMSSSQIGTSSKPIVDLKRIAKLRFQVGTIRKAEFLKKARNPSYHIELDMGDETLKISCGQLCDNYPDALKLVGKQVLGITNFVPRRIAGVKSQVLTLGFADGEGSHQAICLTTSEPVDEGSYINFCGAPFEEGVDFQCFLDLDIRAGTIEEIKQIEEHYFALLDLGDLGKCIAWIPGVLKEPARYVAEKVQVPVWINLKPIALSSGKTFCSMLLTVPLHTSKEAEISLANYRYETVAKTVLKTTLVKVDKSVKNGFPLF